MSSHDEPPKEEVVVSDTKIFTEDQPSTPISANSENFEIDHAAEKKLLLKIDLHLMPILFIVYMLAFLDRVNIGNAKIQGLTTDLKMDGTMFNIASMILFLPYIILEVPSNLILKKIMPSWWISGLMFGWGVVTICQGLVSNYAGLIVCRVFLGVFEAGVFPGCAYLISMYYKRFELQKRLVFFFSGTLLAGAFGGLLAYALAGMDGTGGYAGWRWIFIIEGVVTVGIAIISKFLIADWPEQAKFLSESEKALLALRLERDGAGGSCRMDHLDMAAVKRILSDWKIWCGTIIYMCMTTTGYATSFFIPTILTQFGWLGQSAQLHTIPVYGVGFVLTLACAWFSDRLQHRYLFTIGGLSLACVGYIVLLCQNDIKAADAMPIGVRYAMIFFITSGNYIAQPLAVVWLANNMGGHYKRSFGAAIQIGVGNIGGIVGSNIFLAAEAPYYKTGYGTGLGLLLFGMCMCSVFYFGMMWENKKRDRGERDHRFNLPKDQLENLGDDHPEFRFNG